MKRQMILSGTVAGRQGLPIIEGPHPFFRRAQGAIEGPQGQAQPAASRLSQPPGAMPSVPPINVDEEWLLPDSQPPKRRVSEPTQALDPADLEYVEDDTPPANKAPLPRPPPKLAMPRGWPENLRTRPSEESMAFSLEALIAARSGDSPTTPAPQPAPPKPGARRPQSSVMTSLADLQQLEAERVRTEQANAVKEARRRAAAERTAADAAEPEISLDVLTGKKRLPP
jgi:hypothetical protein